MPSKAMALYAKDNSGFSSKPHPSSNVNSNNRIDYITHQVLKEFLLTPRSATIASRFASNIERRFSSLNLGSDWEKMPDLLQFFQLEMLRESIEVA